MTEYEKLTKDLNDLLVRNYDAIDGYQNAFDKIDSEALGSFFKAQINERTKFAAELIREITVLGAEPATEGSVKATLHRAWMDIRSLVSSSDDAAILEECIRGEEAAIAEYDEILKGETPKIGNLHRVLLSHKHEVQLSLDSLKSLSHIAD